MARTVQEIYDEMLAEKANYSELNGLNSTSKTAIYTLFMWVISFAIAIHEQFFDIHKKEVDDLIRSKRLGTPDWYVDIAKEFQLGYSLLVKQDNTIGYDTIDKEAQIVTRSSFKEDAGVLTLKVAKGEIGALQPLSADELRQFSNYIEDVKLAGTKVNNISLPGDELLIDADIYFDGIYSQSVMDQRVNDVIRDYELNFPFDGILYVSEFYKIIKAVEGVVDIKINSMTVNQGAVSTIIDRSYESQSGYFYYNDLDSNITYNVV